MAKAIISRRGGGSGYATITFNGVSALKRTGAAALVLPRYGLAATTVGNYALFGGGYDNSYRVAVDAYNTSLTRATRTSLSQERANLAATTVGNYALFGGGQVSSGSSSTVDAYRYTDTVQVYPNSIYKLGSMSTEQTATVFQEIQVTPPITGYIKIKNATIY